MSQKDEKIGAVSLLIIQRLSQLERQRINVQSLAESSGVSRAWIYKYFGSNEHEIALTAIDCLAPQFTELNKKNERPASPRAWAKAFLKNLDTTLVEAENYPEVFQFILHAMIYPSEYTARLKHHESLFLEHRVVPTVKEVFGHSTEEARSFAEMLMSLRLGVLINWLRETNKTPATRKKHVVRIRKYIFDQLKEQD